MMGGTLASASPIALDRQGVSSRRVRVLRGGSFVGCAIAGLAVVVGLWLAVLNRHVTSATIVPEPSSTFWWSQALSAGTFIVAGLVLARRPETGWSVCCAVAALGHAVGLLAQGWALQVFVVGRELPFGNTSVWLLSWVLPLEVPAVNWMLLTAPDGHLPPGRWRRVVVWATMTLSVAGVAAGMVTRLDLSDNPLAGAEFPFGSGLDLPEALPFALLLPTLVPVIVLLAMRWRESTGDQRRSMRTIFVMTFAGLWVTLLIADPGLAIGVGQWVTVLQVAALVWVVLRDRMFGIDTLFERTLVTSLLIGLLLVAYASIVAVGDRLFSESVGPFAAVAVALLALPLRERIGRGVVRFVYGDRDRPDRVVEAVARRVVARTTPDEMVAAVVSDVAGGLRLPWIAVDVRNPDGLLAECGTREPGVEPESIELLHLGRSIGHLLVQPRRGEDRMGDRDRAALTAVAPHLASLVDGARSAALLRESRDRLVRVREEERRRLRRDLHDGLGPVLTGVALMTDVARNTLATDPQVARDALVQTRAELSRALDEIRRLVDALRPPVLDELGLVGSIAQQGERFNVLTVTVEHEGDLSTLPAAVEVAAFRIALEAMTNAARHAHATSVCVRLRRGDDLAIEVVDDGSQSAPWVAGVGITSMSDRATEIGGVLSVGPSAAGGGRVSARLPLLP
jgi:signal transduction histidine kinase